MTDIVERLRSNALSLRRQAESAVRMGGPTAYMGEALQLRSSADKLDEAALVIEGFRSALVAVGGVFKRHPDIANSIWAKMNSEDIDAFNKAHTAIAGSKNDQPSTPMSNQT